MIQAGGLPAVNFMILDSNSRYTQCDMAYIRPATSGTHTNMKYDSQCAECSINWDKNKEHYHKRVGFFFSV